MIIITATELQSDGKPRIHSKITNPAFNLLFKLDSWIIIPIRPNANDHIILVWLKNVPFENGIRLIPNAKQYAKCDITAKINNLVKYFFLSCV